MDLPVPERWADAASSVLSVIRRATEPAHAWPAERADPANALIRRPIAPHLREMLVLDLPDLRLFLNHGHFAKWETDPVAAFAAAHDALAAVATTGLVRREEWGLWQLESGDGYAPSRLALPGWLTAFAEAVQGEPVAALPTHHTLLIGDSADPAAMEVLSELAVRAFREGGGPLSPVLYTAGPRGLSPWVPPADHPSAWRARFAERLLAAWEYSEQAPWLAQDEAASVPALALHRTGTDCHTVATVDSLPALLPEADEVLLNGQALPFSDLRAAGRLTPTHHDPVRWLLQA